MKFEKEAIASGQVCPHCGEEEVVEASGIPEIDAAIVFLDVSCLKCEKPWREVYTLTAVKEIKQ